MRLEARIRLYMDRSWRRRPRSALIGSAERNSLIRSDFTVEGAPPLRILGETAYPLSVASARVRIASFAPFLRAHGIELGYYPTLTNVQYRVLASAASVPRKGIVLASSAVRAAMPRAAHDLLLVHRLRLLTPLPGVDPPRRLDIYDLDDALFLGSAAATNRRFQWAKQEARRCVQCLDRASLVIAGNAFLASRAREHARRVEVVPSCVDPTLQPLRTHREAEVVTVGWIGSQTTVEYLRAVLPVFTKVNSGGIRARLVVIGADPALRADWIEHRRWSGTREATDLASFDVGIMPLPDTEWARGKCGYKILQYFSAGVPAIASPVGVNSELIGSERGLLASSDKDWHSALEQLIGDAIERRERGAAARAFVEREYSYQRWAPELAALLRSVAS
jgi:glycosyltransferase involved in cell wall biosynthesis